MNLRIGTSDSAPLSNPPEPQSHPCSCRERRTTQVKHTGKTATKTFSSTRRNFWIFTTFFEKLLYIQTYSLGVFLACLIKQSFMIKISIASIFLKFRFPIFKKIIFLIWIENTNTNHNNMCDINPKRFLATPYPIGWQGIWGRWASVSLSLYACSEDKRWDKSMYYARKKLRSIAWSHTFIILRKHVIPVAG